MADGRCITSYESNRILNDTIMQSSGSNFINYRAYLQTRGPDGLNLPLKNAACGGHPRVLQDES